MKKFLRTNDSPFRAVPDILFTSVFICGGQFAAIESANCPVKRSDYEVFVKIALGSLLPLRSHIRHVTQPMSLRTCQVYSSPIYKNGRAALIGSYRVLPSHPYTTAALLYLRLEAEFKALHGGSSRPTFWSRPLRRSQLRPSQMLQRSFLRLLREM